MQQDQKYWAKNDEMYLGDMKTSQNPTDSFKSNKVPKKKKVNLYEKPLTQNFLEGNNNCPTKKVRNAERRWSEVEARSRSRKPYTQTFKKGHVYLADRGALYTSFARDRIITDSDDYVMKLLDMKDDNKQQD